MLFMLLFLGLVSRCFLLWLILEIKFLLQRPGYDTATLLHGVMDSSSTSSVSKSTSTSGRGSMTVIDEFLAHLLDLVLECLPLLVKFIEEFSSLCSLLL